MPIEDHDYSYDAPTPQELGRISFALAEANAFNRYVALRVHGVHSHIAFRRTFPASWGDDNRIFGLANAVEFNPYTVSKLRDALATVNPADLWNPTLAVHEMLSLARDPMAKDTARLGAMKELNILLNITVQDETGKTRRNRTLEDFYKDVEMNMPVLPDDAAQPKPVEQKQPAAKAAK